MKPAGLVLAIDVGTSSLRTALFTAAAVRLPETTAQISYRLLRPGEGGAELSPQTLRRAARNCIAQTLGSYRDNEKLAAQPIIAVGGSSFWHSFLGVDGKGKPVTPVYTWADARCRDDAVKLRGTFSEEAVHERTGCMLRTSFWPARLAWLRRTRPELVKKAARWLSPIEWLYSEFLGEQRCSLAMASGTGLFDPRSLDWDAELLAHFRLNSDRMAEVSDEPLRRPCRLFPELRDIPWYPGIGDGAASYLGSGATRPGLAAINVGTSAALRVMRGSGEAVAPFGLFCYRVDAERFLLGGAVSNAGNLREWCLRELRVEEGASLEEQLSKRRTPEHGLTVLPFWTAERAPTWNEKTPGVIVGLGQKTTGLDLLQATQEATFQRLAMIADKVMGRVGAVPKFVVSGGILESKSALERLAAVLGHVIHVNPEKEASLRGAAVFALEKLGIAPPQFLRQQAIRPRKEPVQRYQEQRAGMEKLEGLLAALN